MSCAKSSILVYQFVLCINRRNLSKYIILWNTTSLKAHVCHTAVRLKTGGKGERAGEGEKERGIESERGSGKDGRREGEEEEMRDRVGKRMNSLVDASVCMVCAHVGSC